MVYNEINMKKFILSLILFLLFFIWSSSEISAANDKTIYLPEDVTFKGLYFKKADNITIDGNINGETYLIGQNIIVNGNIGGDLIAVGGNVDLNGKINGNARIIAGNLGISSSSLKNITIIAGKTNIEKRTEISENAVIINSDLNFYGKIKGDVKIFSNNFYDNGVINGNAEISSPNISFGDKSIFSSNLNYQSNFENIALSKKMPGRVTFKKSANNRLSPLANFESNTFVSRVKNVSSFASFFSYLIFGFILCFLFPRHFANMVKTCVEKPLASFIVGVLFYIVSPFIILALILTLVGIPLVFLYVGFLALLIFTSRIIIALVIGRKILRDEESKFLPLLIGLIIIQIALWIPFIGTVAKLSIVILATGSAVISKFGKYGK